MEDFATTSPQDHRQAKEIGTEADYDESWELRNDHSNGYTSL